MNKLELMVQEFENLNTEEQESLKGGFVSTEIVEEKDDKQIHISINPYQCGCTNNCKKKP